MDFRSTTWEADRSAVSENVFMCYISSMSQVAVKTEKLMREVLREVRELRQEVSLIIPTESLGGYAHPRRIVSSFRKALKRYPIRKS